jgi:hypothetical protein
MEYRHVQWGYTALPMTLFFAIVAVVFASDDETSERSVAVFLAFLVAIFAIVLLFSRLEVTVGGGTVVAAFGFGWPRRVVDLEEVTAVRRVRNTWMQGWGIRSMPNGWMYNVWGLDAVELELSSGKVFRIGTNDAENLHTAIALQPRG